MRARGLFSKYSPFLDYFIMNEFTEYLKKCVCNRCDTVYVDTNSSENSTVLPWNGEIELESGIDTDGENYSAGCPKCKTDAFLTDL